MTEHDRGAYTPQPDAPLQFDARSPRRRKPMPMTLIGSGAVLVVLLGALALHARHDAKGGPDAARPVGSPIAEVKTAAPATAQPKDAAAVDVFGGSAQTTAKTTAQTTAQPAAATAARAPTFAPPPEAPKPRAQLTVQTAEAAPIKVAPLATTNAPTTTPAATPTTKTPTITAPTIKTTTVASAAVPKPAPVYHAPTTAAATAPARPDAGAVVARLADAPAAKPAAAKASLAAAQTATPKASGGAFGGSVVQIGAFSSMGLSEKGWADVSSAMSAEMSGKMKKVEAVEKDGKTFYRTSVAGFPNRTAAEAFCRSLTAKGHACFAKG